MVIKVYKEVFVTKLTVRHHSTLLKMEKVIILESILEKLRTLGLTENEANVYFHLSKTGSEKASNLAKFVGVSRVQLYSILKSLQEKGFVESTFEYPAYYIAVPLAKVIDLFIKAKETEVHEMKKSKNIILSQWEQLQLDTATSDKSKFMVLQGRKFVYSKIKQMIQHTKKVLRVVTSSQGIVQACQAGLLDLSYVREQKSKVHFRFITNLTDFSMGLDIIKGLIEASKGASLHAEPRIADLGSGNFPRFVIADDYELIFFLKPTDDLDSIDEKDTGLWTNNRVLVNAFEAFFEELWRGSTDFNEKVSEAEDKTDKSG